MRASFNAKAPPRASTVVVIGPAISQKNCEVGAEFFGRFAAILSGSKRFFAASARDGRFMLDLPAFIAMQLRAAGIVMFEDLSRDTYAEPEWFFSYRRSVHKGEPDYGQQIAVVALA